MLPFKNLSLIAVVLLSSSLFIRGMGQPIHPVYAESYTYHIIGQTSSGCISSPGTIASIRYPFHSQAGATFDLVMNYTITDPYNFHNGGTFGVQISGWDGAWLGGGGTPYSPYTGIFTAQTILPTTDERELYLQYWCSGYGSVSIIDYELIITITPPASLTDQAILAEAAVGLQRIAVDTTLPVIIYTPTPAAAANGELFIDIWQLDEDATGYPTLYISADELLALPDFPAENTLIAETDDEFIAVYKLTTGEFQVNVGPLSDGKIHVIIFDSIPPIHTYGYTWEVSE